MGAGGNRPGARPRAGTARGFPGGAVGSGVAGTGAELHPSGRRRHPDGRAGRRGRLHRRNRAPARALGGPRARRPPIRLGRASIAPAASSPSSSTSWSAARRPCRSSCSPNTRRCSAHAASRSRLPPISSSRPPGCATRFRMPRRPFRRRTLTAHLLQQRRVYQHGLLAFLRGDADGARKMRDAAAGIERGHRAGIGKGVLVDRRRVLRRHRRGWTGTGLWRKAARRPARPSDPPCRRGLGEGRRATAARGALLRRGERAGDAARAIGPGRLRTSGAHPDGRGAERGSGEAPADPARDARAARRGEEHLAEGHAGPGREPATAAGDAAVGARQCIGDRQRGAGAADGIAGQPAGRDAAVGRSVGCRGDGVCDGRVARRERCRKPRQARGQFPGTGRGDALPARRGAGWAPDPRGHRAADRRNLPPCAGTDSDRAGRARDAGQPAAHGAGARRVLPRPRATRRARYAGQGQPADSRRAAHAGTGRRRAPACPLPGADRQLREPGHRGRRRST